MPDQVGIVHTCRWVVHKRGYMNHQGKIRRSVLLAVFVIGVVTSPLMAGADGSVLTVTNESKISINVDNEPLNALLRLMAEKKLFNISGGAAGNESLTLHLSNLTLPEVLSKVLRGYNYVVTWQGKNQPPVLTIIGKIDKGAAGALANTPASAATLPEPRGYAPPEPAPEPPAPPTMSPGQPVTRQPQTPQETQPPGEAGKQPGSEVQKQAGQQAPSGQPVPQAEAPPAESPGIHF